MSEAARCLPRTFPSTATILHRSRIARLLPDDYPRLLLVWNRVTLLYTSRPLASLSDVCSLNCPADHPLAASIVVPSIMADSVPYTNGHSSLVALDTAIPDAPSSPSEDAPSEPQEAAAASSDEDADADADGEEYHEEEQMEVDAESSEDAEGEADSDFGSDSPPPQEERRRAPSSTSQDSSRPSKRKASVEDVYSTNPELYGLRRSVSGLVLQSGIQLTVTQGRARPTRRIVSTLLL